MNNPVHYMYVEVYNEYQFNLVFVPRNIAFGIKYPNKASHALSYKYTFLVFGAIFTKVKMH